MSDTPETDALLDRLDAAMKLIEITRRERDEARRQVDALCKALESMQDDPAVAGTGEYESGLLCGIEDRGFQKDGYSAMRHGYDRALERCSEYIDGALAEARKARWRECAERLADAFRGVPYDPYTVGGFNAQKCKEALAEFKRLKEGGK